MNKDTSINYLDIENNIEKIEEIIDYLIQELEVKDMIIEELETKYNSNEKEESKEKINSLIEEPEDKDALIEQLTTQNTSNEKSDDTLVLPLKFINIHIGLPLLIAYLKNNYLNEFNKILLNIDSNEYTLLNEKNLSVLLSSLYKYIDRLPIKTPDTMNGVSKVLESLDKALLNDFLPDIYKNIFSKSFCLYNLNKDMLLDFLIKYFLEDYTSQTTQLLNEIIDKEFYIEYSDDKFIDLLLISAYFNKHNTLMKSTNKSTVFKKPKYKSTMDVLVNITDQSKLLNRFNSFNDFKAALEYCNLDISKKIYDNLSLLNFTIKDLYTNKDKVLCDNDKHKLKVKLGKIPVYDLVTDKEVRVISTKLLWCEKCNRYSLNNELLKAVYKRLDVNETLKFSNFNNLNQKSPLLVLGYNSKVPRPQRWNLLTTKIIPILGLNKVINHINFLININKNKVSKDLSTSLNEWNHDINKIKEHFNVI